MEEDVYKNPFFSFLRDSCPDLYQQCATQRLLLLVPHSSSLPLGMKIPKSMMESHILRVSPYFQDEYVTLNGKCCALKNQHVMTRSGFSESRDARILFEEMFYNDDNKSYRVLCISIPLEGEFIVSKDLAGNSKPAWLRSVLEHHDFLCNVVPTLLVTHLSSSNINTSAIKSLKQHVSVQIDTMLQSASQFQQTYVLVQAFLQHASDKIKNIVERAYVQIVDLAAMNSKLAENENLQGEVWLALESISMAAMGRKLFQQLQAFDQNRHQTIVAKCVSLVGNLSSTHTAKSTSTISKWNTPNTLKFDKSFNKVHNNESLFSLASLGLRSELCNVNVNDAIDLLQKLDDPASNDDQITPMCKFAVLKDINESLRASVDKIATANRITLATDDMLPLWVFSLVHGIAKGAARAEPSVALLVLTNICYLTTFYLPSPKAPYLTSELPYLVTNLQAAVSFIEHSLFAPESKASTAVSFMTNKPFIASSNNSLRPSSRSHSISSTAPLFQFGPDSTPRTSVSELSSDLKSISILQDPARSKPNSRNSSVRGVNTIIETQTPESFLDKNVKKEAMSLFDYLKDMDDNSSVNISKVPFNNKPK